MTDVHNNSTRSYNMSRIKAKDTKPEMLVTKYLHAEGLRYRLHNTKLPGKPDLTFSKYHMVIFVNGCFWHGHQECKYFVLPKTRTDWWKEKIEETKIRDQKTLDDLKVLGWNSLTIWECELKPMKRNTTLNNILFTLTKRS